MSVSKMKKLTVVCRIDDTDAIVRRLMRERAVSLTQSASDPLIASLDGFSPHTDAETARARLSRVEAARSVLSKHSTRKWELFPAQPVLSHDAFKQGPRYDTAWKIVEETEKILSGVTELRSQAQSLQEALNAYRPFLDLELDLSFTGTEATVFLLGSFPGGTRPERITEALSGIAAEIGIVSSDATGTYVSLIAHRSAKEQALRALSTLGFIPTPLQGENKSAKTCFDLCQSDLQETEHTIDRLQARLSVLAEKLDDIEVLYDIERTTLLTEENKTQLAKTEHCAVLRGWCPARKTARIRAVLDDYCTAYELEEPSKDDEPPVLLRNNAFARNFEWVLGMYAYPKYGTFDPTFVMSIFYFLIFGIMFADAGYGLLMSVACFAAVRWLHPRDSMKRFLLMFGYCGISCIIFGILFGSYFGNFPIAFLESVVGKAPEEMPRLSILPAKAANVAVLLDPIENPMAFLVIALGMGALHLIAGMAVKAFILCRQGKPLDALFDIVSYWVLFAGLGALMLSKKVALILCITGVAMIVLTQGRHKKGILMKFVGGLGGLYNLINFAADLLSYSRILALGLASAVIAQVVNTMATLKGATFTGILIMLIVFVIGHLLNLVINVLGTFVHTARLQYIEFFNKFFEEGGTPFRPMAPSDLYSSDAEPTQAEATEINK